MRSKTDFKLDRSRSSRVAGSPCAEKPAFTGYTVFGLILITAFYIVAIPDTVRAQSKPSFDPGREMEITSVTLFDTLSLTLSESYLYNVAESQVKQNRRVGAAYIGLGVAGVVYGSVLMGYSDEEDRFYINRTFGEMYTILGAASIAGGLIVLAGTPPAEKQWLKYLPDRHLETDVSDRARTAREVLRTRATRAKYNRIFGSVLGGAVGLVLFSGTGEDMTFASIAVAGGTVVGLINKSAAEVQWENYMRETGEPSRNPVRVGIGLLPGGGGVVTARLSL